MSRQKILPGGMIVRDEKHAELRGRFFNCLKDYLFEQRYAPVSSPGLRIHRASTMLQKIFFAYREATWSRFYSEVSLPTRFDGITVVMDDPEKLGRKNGWFAEFPERYFVNNIDAKNKLLVMSPCHDIGVLKKLIEQLFAGIDVNIEEVKVRLKQPTEYIIICKCNRKEFDVDCLNSHTHWCMRVELRTTGRETSLDLSGVQYGMIQPDMPWESHSSFFVNEVLATKPLGTLAKYAGDLAKTKGTEGLRFEVAAGAMDAWHNTVDAAMEKKGLTWADVLGKDEEAYDRHTKKILSVGTKAMQKYAAETKLTKRRLKAQRYEQRHGDELEGEIKELEKEYLE